MLIMYFSQVAKLHFSIMMLVIRREKSMISLLLLIQELVSICVEIPIVISLEISRILLFLVFVMVVSLLTMIDTLCFIIISLKIKNHLKIKRWLKTIWLKELTLWEWVAHLLILRIILHWVWVESARMIRVLAVWENIILKSIWI